MLVYIYLKLETDREGGGERKWDILSQALPSPEGPQPVWDSSYIVHTCMYAVKTRVHNKNSEGECLTTTVSAKITAYV